MILNRKKTVTIGIAMAALISAATIHSYWQAPATLAQEMSAASSQRELRGPRANLGSVGDPNVLAARYEEWVGRHEAGGGDHNVLVGLGWSKGLSSRYTKAEGGVVLDLFEGTASVVIDGLPEGAEYEVWLVDNLAGPGRSIWPEEGDSMLNLGHLALEGGRASLETSLGEEALADFDLNLVVVTEAPHRPEVDGLLFGMPIFFQDRYTAARKQGVDLANNFGVQAIVAPQFGTPVGPAQPLVDLVGLGEKLFFGEKFGGNGRTCGTCHPSSNNFTIDPRFIATLDAADPLFVAENNPALATLERPELMRKVGLILVNSNGFGNLATNFTMRGVPHTLGLGLSILGPIDEFPTVPPEELPVHRTGWGGDGSPVGFVRDSGFDSAGTLKHFAVGAVAQHFPKTLARLFNPIAPLLPDFRLPTDEELVALEAFQLSLGRQEELDLSEMTFTNELVQEGNFLFSEVGGASCFRCHKNAGANNFNSELNGTINTGVEKMGNTHAELISGPGLPADDGFVNTHRFNVPSIVEAADTGPFFHNNSVRTIEEAVAFYNSDAFAASPSGIVIDMTPTEVTAIAAFLRMINVQENIREAKSQIERAVLSTDPSRRAALFCRAANEIEDAIEVLECGVLDPDLAQQLRDVLALLETLCADSSALSTGGGPLELDALGDLDIISASIVQ